jgi:hypothetical protein
MYLQRLYNDPTIWGASGGRDRAFIHYGGFQKSYKSLKGQVGDFLAGDDAHVALKPFEHY